jgi:hypothetical protein
VERTLHLDDELALAAHLEREAALADLDRAVRGRLGGNGRAHVTRPDLRGGQRSTGPRDDRCGQRRRHVLPPPVLSPRLRQQLPPAPRALE